MPSVQIQKNPARFIAGKDDWQPGGTLGPFALLFFMKTLAFQSLLATASGG
jgi:hypothetical protein